jgi:hypothetical protein
MADVIHGVTQLANWLPTVFAPAAYGYFMHERTLSNWCTDYSSLLASGAKAVTVPLSAAVVAESRGAGAETPVEYTGSGSAETAGTITVNQFYTAAFLITDAAQLQTNVQLMEHYVQGTAYALRSAFETYLAGTIIQSATTNDVTLGTDNTITAAKLQEGIQNLLIDNAYVPGMVALGLSPEAWATSVADWGALYYHVSATGNPTMLTNGQIGSILGIPIYVSDDWDGDGTQHDETGSLWHKRAVGYALQNAFQIIGPVADPTRGGTGFSVELYYGATKMLDAGIANFNNP